MILNTNFSLWIKYYKRKGQIFLLFPQNVYTTNASLFWSHIQTHLDKCRIDLCLIGGATVLNWHDSRTIAFAIDLTSCSPTLEEIDTIIIIIISGEL